MPPLIQIVAREEQIKFHEKTVRIKEYQEFQVSWFSLVQMKVPGRAIIYGPENFLHNSNCELFLSELLRTKKLLNLWDQDIKNLLAAETTSSQIHNLYPAWRHKLQQKLIYGRISIKVEEKNSLDIMMMTSLPEVDFHPPVAETHQPGAALINPFFRTLAYEDIHSIELYGVVGYTLSNSLKELRDSSPYDTLDTAYFFYIRVVFYK